MRFPQTGNESCAADNGIHRKGTVTVMLETFARKHIAKTVWIALAVGLIPVGRANAQTQSQASVDLGGAPSAKDPHPATYFWEGKPEVIKDSLKFYTFYYTGPVNGDATVPLGEKIQRIPVANDVWKANKDAIVGRLKAFYEEAYNVANNPGSQPKVAFDENYNYVEVGGTQAKNAAMDPLAAAEWTFYYDQFVLWQFYCRRVLLNDTDATKASSSREDLQRASDLQSLQGFEGVNAEEALNAAKEIREQQEAADAAKSGKPGAGKKPTAQKTPVAAAKGGKGGRGKGPAPKPAEITSEVATEFNPDLDYADPHHNDAFRDEFVRLAGEREKESVRMFTDMLGRINKRADETQRYEDWLTERRGQLQEFAKAWGKVKAGASVNFENTTYFLTKEPLETQPIDTVNVVVRDAVTPQDLLDANGKLKKPAAE